MKVMKPVVAFLREIHVLNNLCGRYSMMGEDPARFSYQLDFTPRELFQAFGLVINWEKS